MSARVTAHIGTKPYSVALTAGRHQWLSDEPPALGGADAGPAPYDLLLASLAACTVITLRMYAERKGWPLVGVAAELVHGREDDRSRIDRTLWLEGELTDEQRARLGEIAERTPVTLTLKAGAAIHTTLA